VAEPQDDLTYTWTIDGEAAGNGQQLPAIINDPGKHNVVLNALTQYGCGSKTTYDVAVQGDVAFVPNVFTPNDDNLNAEFQVLGVERSTWDLKVFNRWGEPVFEQRDYKNTWRANGVATGVYYYLLKNAICPGREYKGVISIIR
jgi:gliding motility-associated-like protein